jgi:EAL domain-containing protein (putative c-di-GMP-specific phosphodiesterase class I)
MRPSHSSSLTMAFHPIVDLDGAKVWGYEALVRGTGGETALGLLRRITDQNSERFDQACALAAIDIASRVYPADGTAMLSINFLAGAMKQPRACTRMYLEAVMRRGLRPDRVMFEFSGGKRLPEVERLQDIVAEFKQAGFRVGVDNFGGVYSGLGLLTKVAPDIIKIDMDLIRDIAVTPAKQLIVAGMVAIARQLGIVVAAEGVETETEVRVLRGAGIRLFQGYYFAKPEIERLPDVPRIALAGQSRAA